MSKEKISALSPESLETQSLSHKECRSGKHQLSRLLIVCLQRGTLG